MSDLTRKKSRKKTSEVKSSELRVESGELGTHNSELTAGPRATDNGPLTTDVQLSTRRLVPLLPYQRKWIDDGSPLKIVVKARQIGFSFAAALRVVLECLKRKTTWILLSKGERQSRLLMEKVREHIHMCGIVAETREEEYFENTMVKQLETRFPNGSVIYALPANPDTARGYSGNVTLDEFAFHADADRIYSALYPSITRGYQLEVISTPNGTQGKFYEIAKSAGLVGIDSLNHWAIDPLKDKRPAASSNGSMTQWHNDSIAPHWSGHCVDIYEAAREGLKINIPLLRSGCEDETAWQQEFCCQFISTAENFFSPNLLAACLSAEASTDCPPLLLARESESPASVAISAPGASVGSRQKAVGSGDSKFQISNSKSAEFYLGVDIGRKHDRTVFWLDEVRNSKIENRNSKLAIPPLGEGAEDSPGSDFRFSNFEFRVSTARLVHTLSNTPFDDQKAYARQLLLLRETGGSPLIRRVAIDATGMGAPLAESLAQEFGARVEPVVFTATVKEDLAYRTRRRMEQGLTLLPDSADIRRAFSAVKKFVTVAGNVRFDAERTEAGHADEFWAKALADLAADIRPASRLADGYIASGRPIISPSAFMEANQAISDFRF